MANTHAMKAVSQLDWCPQVLCCLVLQVNSLTTLYNYYEAAYAAVRSASASCFAFVAPRTWEEDSGPSASATPASWQAFMSQPPYANVLLDLHKCAVAHSI